MSRERPDHRHDPEHEVPAVGDGARARRTPVQALQRSLGNSGILQLRAAMRRGAIQRHGGGDHVEEPEITVPGGGQPLSPVVQRRAEQALGVSMQDVRVVAGADAACQAADALAFTTHDNGTPTIALSSDVDPATPDGQFTLMHELTHVAQQKRGQADDLHGLGGDEGTRSSLEADADAGAARILERNDG